MSNEQSNHLFPVFLKLHNLHLLLIGGGKVAEEKLGAILSNSPRTRVRLVAKNISTQVRSITKGYPNIVLVEAAFEPAHLAGIDLVICAIDNPETSETIRTITREAGILSNFADKPGLCDFYLGSVVQKGHVKIGISTNGKSPTLAKRLKEILQDALPDDLNALVEQLAAIRNSVRGNIAAKVKVLDKATGAYVRQRSQKKHFAIILLKATAAVLVILAAHLLLNRIWHMESTSDKVGENRTSTITKY